VPKKYTHFKKGKNTTILLPPFSLTALHGDASIHLIKAIF